jgi:glycerol-3-phosphate acyltransferase PlsY
MVYFQTKNTNLGVLLWTMLEYFVAIWYILWLCFPSLVCSAKENLATLISIAQTPSAYHQNDYVTVFFLFLWRRIIQPECGL